MLSYHQNRSRMDDYYSQTSDSTYFSESPDSSRGSPLTVYSSLNSLERLTTIPLRHCVKRLRTSDQQEKSFPESSVRNCITKCNNYDKLCRIESPSDFGVDCERLHSTPRTTVNEKMSNDDTSTYPLLKRALLERPPLVDNGYCRLNPSLVSEMPENLDGGPDSATSNLKSDSRQDNNDINSYPLIKGALARPPLLPPLLEVTSETFRHYKKRMLRRMSETNVNVPLDLSKKRR